MSVTPLASPDPASTNWVPLWGAATPVSTIVPTSTRVYRSTTQSIPNNTATAISFDSVRWDKGGQWAAGNPTRLTCQLAGTYSINAYMQYDFVAGGSARNIVIRKNGVTTLGQGGVYLATAAFAAGYPYAPAAAVADLVPGDYVEAVAYQDSGSAVNILAPTDANSQARLDFGMALMGGPAGPTGVGVPTPVTNGQWIKGQAGAAVWAPIAQADLPVNLQANTSQASGNDLNNATSNGWYLFTNSPQTANVPAAGTVGQVEVILAGSLVKQIAYHGSLNTIWTRTWNGGAWSPWVQIQPIPESTTLPASSVDGQETILVDSTTAPTYQWRLRYNAGSSSTYKWETVGGVAATVTILTSETTASTTAVNLATPGPSFTLPRPGDYLIGAGHSGMNGGAGQIATADFYAGGAAFGLSIFNGNQYRSSVARGQVLFAGRNQGDAIQLLYRSTGGTATFHDRWVSVQPVRIS